MKKKLLMQPSKLGSVGSSVPSFLRYTDCGSRFMRRWGITILLLRHGLYQTVYWGIASRMNFLGIIICCRDCGYQMDGSIIPPPNMQPRTMADILMSPPRVLRLSV